MSLRPEGAPFSAPSTLLGVLSGTLCVVSVIAFSTFNITSSNREREILDLTRVWDFIRYCPCMESKRILDGIRVVDMTQYLAGPTVTRMMAEMGADIIKIEQAPGGDPSRNYAIINEKGRSGYFVQQNRGKKSLCINFDDPQGKDILLKLIGEADVFVENYGPGVLERRQLHWQALKETNPRLIMASISGFGKESSMSDRPAFDMIAQAFSGTMYMTGAPE